MVCKTITLGENIGIKMANHLHLKPPIHIGVFMEIIHLIKDIKLTFILMI